MNSYFETLKKYAVFSGRARRKEYWTFFFCNFGIEIVLIIIDNLVGTVDPDSHLGLLSSLFALGTLLPSIAVFVRRLHDTGRSGWWAWIGLIPLAGGIIVLVFAVQDSQPGDNRFGPNPKAGLPGLPAGSISPPPPPAAAPSSQASPPPVPAHREYCPSCGAPSEGANFCPQCGAVLHRKNECSSCGASFVPGTKFCAQCGAKVS